MTAFLFSLGVGYIIYILLYNLLQESKLDSLTFAIFMFIAASLLFSKVLAPKETVVTKYNIEQLITKIKQTDIKSNEDIIESLERAVDIGQDTLTLTQIKYYHSKLAYLRVMYPTQAMLMLVNRNSIQTNKKQKWDNL